MTMNIYLVSQSVNTHYDVYDSMVVIAETEERAKYFTVEKHHSTTAYISRWAAYEHLTCKLVGITLEGSEEKIILESFNAG